MQFHPQYAETVKALEEALNNPRLHVFGRVNTWLINGALPEEILEIVPRVAKQGYWRGGNLNYFDGFIASAIAARTKPMPEAQPRVDTERDSRRHKTGEYEPPAHDNSDFLDITHAKQMMRGIRVMSVTPRQAERMVRKGLLTPEKAAEFGFEVR